MTDDDEGDAPPAPPDEGDAPPDMHQSRRETWGGVYDAPDSSSDGEGNDVAVDVDVAAVDGDDAAVDGDDLSGDADNANASSPTPVENMFSVMAPRSRSRAWNSSCARSSMRARSDSSSLDDDDEFPSSRGVRFHLGPATDDLIDSESESEQQQHDESYPDHHNSDSEMSEGTTVPGTQLAPYSRINAPLRRELLGASVAPPAFLGIEPEHEDWIRKAMLDDWGICYPHEFQVRAIHRIAFSDNQLIYVVAKTGSGKSAIPLTAGSLLTGVTLSMVPLVGLGSDQVNKSTNHENCIESFHLDEMRGIYGQVLRKRLVSLHQAEADAVSIFLYASPQSLLETSPWFPCLSSIARRGFLRLICIDEAHTVNQDGRSFRPDFRIAMKSIKRLHAMMRSPCNIVAMSATFRFDDQKVISDLLDRTPDAIFWLELSRRTIYFDVVISGQPSSSAYKCIASDYKFETDLKTIVYTNSMKAAQGSITESTEAILDASPNRGESIAMTGADGMQFKVLVMHAFAADSCQDDDERTEFSDLFPNLRIMPATKAADCGVSSRLCRRSYRIGFASSMHVLVQEMGRVDRVPCTHGVGFNGDNRYEIHISLNCLLALYLRIMQHPDAIERGIQFEAMFEVLVVLVVPNKCQHALLEDYFGNPNCTVQYAPCQSMCNFCSRGAVSLTGRINRDRLCELLIGFFTGKENTAAQLVKFIKLNKTSVYHKNNVPKKEMGQIHALCLQLIAVRIIELSVSDEKKHLIGKKGILPAHVTVRLGMVNKQPRILKDVYWERICVNG